MFEDLLAATKLIAFFEALMYTIIGLMIFFASEIFTAIREIALNSRKKTDSDGNSQSSTQGEYNGLITASVLIKIIGVIIIIMVWVVFFFAVSISTPSIPFR